MVLALSGWIGCGQFVRVYDGEVLGTLDASFSRAEVAAMKHSEELMVETNAVADQIHWRGVEGRRL